MHIISADQFRLDQIDNIFERADYFKREDSSPHGRQKLVKMHHGRQMCSLFYQPSTRTRLSFETAAIKMGMGLVGTENAREHSSSAKGETIEDTIRVLNGYNYDLIVMRHFEVGAAKRAAVVSKAPIINAGDGKGEHPTQALLDAYTINKKHGRLSDLKIVFGGDLKYGRTVRSLSQLLSKYRNNAFTFVATPELQVSQDIKQHLLKAKSKVYENSNLKEAFDGADVIYWTRLQTENLEDSNIKNNGFIIDEKTLKFIPKKAIIMHPLPRVDEIDSKIDNDPRAVYFEQAANGLYVRMALLDTVMQNG